MNPNPAVRMAVVLFFFSRDLRSLASDGVRHLYGPGSEMKQEGWLKLQRPHGLSWPPLQWPFSISSRQLWIEISGVSEVWTPRSLAQVSTEFEPKPVETE